MDSKKVISIIFYLSAAYDGLLGLAFLLAPRFLFDYFTTVPPNHLGYVQFPACLLITFAILFMAVARDPHANRNLIPYGVMLKASYCGVAGTYWVMGTLPQMWQPFVICDLVMGLSYLWAYVALTPDGQKQSACS